MGGVRTGLDVGSLAAALSRPGIDPRVWLTLAVVTDVAYDEDFGVFADIRMQPNGDIETCLVGSEYAGDGYGTFIPPAVDDIVLVAVPEGDPGFGPVLVKRLFGGGERPPPEFQNPDGGDPTDAATAPVTRVEDGKVVRIVMKNNAGLKLEIDGGGAIEINATGNSPVNVNCTSTVTIECPDVRLGVNAGQGIARIGDLVAVSVPAMVVGGPGGPPVVPAVGLPTATGGVAAAGQIISGSGSAKAGT